MVTEIYYRKALAQIEKKHSLLEKTHSLLEDEHSQIKTKHALLEAEHEEMKTKYSKLEEEHAELRDERNDLEGDTWLWMMQNNKLQAQHKELQAEHSQWKAACASLVEEVERKVLEEEYLAYLAQEYGQTQWPVAKVAELEVEQERKLAEAHELAKEREQALMDKVTALESEIVTLKTTSKSEVASLRSTIQQKDDDFDSFRRSSKEATDLHMKQLAAAKAKAMKHQELRRTLRTALEKGVKTALVTTNPVKERRLTKPVEVSAPTQQEQRPKLREKSSSCGSPSTVSSKAAAKTTATSAMLLKVPAQTLQRPGRKQELTKPKEIKNVPSKATSRWEQYKNQRSGLRLQRHRPRRRRPRCLRDRQLSRL
uniref:Uncharacterized protein n=1 Tax=Phytophthora ramorum TaxID=164328 RepID=H3H2Q9_PHYRM